MDFDSSSCSNNPSDYNGYCAAESTIPFIALHLNDFVKQMMVYVGSLYSSKVTFYLFVNAYLALKLYVWPLICKPNLLKKYGEYVIVTNTLDSIGTELAKEFARRGHSLVLIGENNEHFRRVQKEIESEVHQGRSVRVIVYDKTSNDDKIYQHIEDELTEIKNQIGILVNNAGVVINRFGRYLEYTDENVLDLVHSNIVDIVMITKAVLPIMVENKKGLILNVTSPGNLRPIGFCGFPSTMKDYVDKFGRVISGEYRIHNINVQTLNPGWIRERPNSYFPSFLMPTVKTYVNSAISTIGKSEQTAGYWSHSLMNKLLDFVPSSVHTVIFYFYRKCCGKDEHLSAKQEVMEMIGVIKEAIKED